MDTRRPLGSSDGPVSALSTRAPAVSSTAISLPFGSGGSLKTMRISFGARARRASDAGLERM